MDISSKRTVACQFRHIKEEHICDSLKRHSQPSSFYFREHKPPLVLYKQRCYTTHFEIISSVRILINSE